MAYVVVWTEWPCGADPTDHYVICETEREAHDRYNMLWRNGQDVWCAAYTKVMDATEPHWIDDLSDGPTDPLKEN